MEAISIFLEIYDLGDLGFEGHLRFGRKIALYPLDLNLFPRRGLEVESRFFVGLEIRGNI